jgi:hypothetical protein
MYKRIKGFVFGVNEALCWVALGRRLLEEAIQMVLRGRRCVCLGLVGATPGR